jgi:uncharacterized HAD superfamily protein
MQLIIDLDGTICTEEKTFSRSLATPLNNARESIKKLKNCGHTIILYTARGWNEYEMTVKWLENNKIIFDQLIMGKPIGDFWIDDRAIKFSSWSDVMRLIK